jgi:CHAD domain-containing protein
MSDAMTAPPEASRSLIQWIQAAAVDQLSHAIRLLTEQSLRDPTVVHEIRKAVKRIRATLQLVRGELTEFSPWDRQLRDVNRALSSARDLDMCRKTLADLRADRSPHGGAIESLDARLTERRAQLPPVETLAGDAHELAAALERIRAGLCEWAPPTGGFELVRPAVRRNVRKSRRLIGRLQSAPHSEDVHALRKLVKRRLYWLQVLQPIWPRGLSGEEKLVDALADRLGKHHDLEVLIDHARQSAGPHEKSLPKPLSKLIRKLQSRQRKYAQRALTLARYLYAERPKAFTRRWEAYAAIWGDSPPEKVQAPAIDHEPLRARPR